MKAKHPTCLYIKQNVSFNLDTMLQLSECMKTSRAISNSAGTSKADTRITFVLHHYVCQFEGSADSISQRLVQPRDWDFESNVSTQTGLYSTGEEVEQTIPPVENQGPLSIFRITGTPTIQTILIGF